MDYINKIVQGNCLEVLKGIPDESIDLCLTDPPYGMNYQSSWRIDKHDKIIFDDSIEWFESFAKQLFRIMKNDTHTYIFCNDYAISYFRNWLELAGFVNKRVLVWVKNNHTSGDLEGDYGNKTEFLLYAHKGKRKLNGKRNTNVLYYSRENTDNHPTAKPISLCGFLIEKSSNKSDIVLDPFSGSFTTALAAEMLNRNWIGIELSPEYCAIGQQRLDIYRQQLKLF